MSAMMRDAIDAWPRALLAQRLEDCRVLLLVHGLLRDSESERIKKRIKQRWDTELCKPTGDKS